MGQPLLCATSIRKSFAGVRALADVSFDVRPGEVHALVGENGAGKSTLIRIIAGAEQADSGSLEIAGVHVDPTRLTPSRARAAGIAVIYQQPALFPHLTVAENIALTLEPADSWRPIDWRARRQRAADLLARAGARFGPDRVAGLLSMPEQQLVEIARAIGRDARIVLMDEPTASLTDHEVDHLFGVVARLKGDGVGVLYISHRLDEVFTLADRITVLRDGETVMSDACVAVSRGEVVGHMAGREPSSVLPARTFAPGPVALELRALSAHTAGVRDVSLQIRRGEILGVAGLVGSGRTELAETIFGLHRVDAGELLVDGAPASIASPADAIARGIAYVPEDRRRHGAILDMSIAANTSLACLPSISHRGLVQREPEQALAARFVTDLRIKAHDLDAAVGTLSGGNQQKVVLGRWLATNPSVLILDEPTQGVDVGAKAEIHAVMRAMVERGLAILMISSELPEVLDMSDRVAVMRDGTIAATLDRADATAESVLAIALAQSAPTVEHG